MEIQMIPKIENIKYSDSNNFFLLAGPCVVENEKNVFEIAEKLLEIAEKLKIPYIFKASFKKANRSRIDSFTGIGDEKALKILQKVKTKLNIPIVTDIHSPEDAKKTADYDVDILQIPAFLSRQTNLLIAAGKTGKFVNIKKGQFMSPDAMQFAAQKVEETGNSNIMLTDRGTMFGYGDLIVDFRSVPIMQKTGFPVVVDITHSLQQPNQTSGITGGQPEMIETMGKASVATGADGIFMETHPNPSEAKSDGANMLHLSLAEELLTRLVKIRQVVNTFQK
ncbi:MAG: 3-deoxy-8-phosphooctulonate synthase [Chlorobi bacterium]|nr:3-deoxy-8-phosphooctulonate synthase [Chlorobiota bacterium]